MHFGLCTISAKGTDADRILAHAAAAGFDGVEIWGGHVGDGGATPKTVRQAVGESDLDLPVYGSYLRPGTAEFDDRLRDELGVAVALNADLIRVWAGKQEYGDHDAGHWEDVVADLRTLTDAATDRGVAVTVERHEGTLTNTTEGARRLVDAVGDANCRLNWQPLFGMSASEIQSEARELGPLANNVHLQAVSERGGSTRCALDDAFFDVEATVSSLAESGFDGYANVEFVRQDVDYREAIDDDLACLRSATA